jgi:hypothetical protein
MAAPATPAEFIERCNAVVAEITLLRSVYEDMRDVAGANNVTKESVDTAYTEMTVVCPEQAGGKRHIKRSDKRRVTKGHKTRRH